MGVRRDVNLDTWMVGLEEIMNSRRFVSETYSHSYLYDHPRRKH